jgi:L-iditol 2-dehydrogenase
VKAVSLSGTRQIELVEIDEPVAGDDEIIIEVKATGICGSDMHAYRGHHPFRRPPVILGHEVAGVVLGVGSAVTGFRRGDKVAVEPQIACRGCAMCLDGLPNLCANMRRPGQPGANWSGTFAERIVAPDSVVYGLGEATSYEEGSMIEPLAVAYRAFRRGQVAMGMKVAVLGAGNIGALFAHLCQQTQVSKLLVTDLKDYNLDFVRSLGSCTAVNAGGENTLEVGLELTEGTGFDVVAIASGAPSSLLEAVELCRPNGVIVLISIYSEPILADATRMVLREVEVRASLTYTPKDFREATRLINSRGIDLRPFITRRVPLDQAASIFREMDDGLDYIKVMFDLDDAGGSE